uniref:GrpE protein homolog n=1 Tax=Piliocolobus tephrosceles TaxID=591936 RepID=A0A8C9GTT4_9PRIM
MNNKKKLTKKKKKKNKNDDNDNDEHIQNVDKQKIEINYEKLNKIELINEIKKTKKDIEEKLIDNKILKEKYLSVLAEKENLRNRYMKEIENSKLYCISNFAKSLLDVADNLSLAIKNISDESLKKNEEIHNIYKGIEMTENILHNIFNKYGIDKYNPLNEKFDPLYHEALFEINDTTKEKGTVATVVQEGYKINDRILRAAKVGVVKN